MIEIGYDTANGPEEREIYTDDLTVNYEHRIVQITQEGRTTTIPFERVYYWEADEDANLSKVNVTHSTVGEARSGESRSRGNRKNRRDR